MTQPSEAKCPYGCGADIETTCRDGLILWTCGVVRNSIKNGGALSKQTDKCRIAQQAARIAELEDALENIKAVTANIWCKQAYNIAAVALAERSEP